MSGEARTYIIKDKNNKVIFVSYSEDQAYERVDFEKGETVEEEKYSDLYKQGIK